MSSGTYVDFPVGWNGVPNYNWGTNTGTTPTTPTSTTPTSTTPKPTTTTNTTKTTTPTGYWNDTTIQKLQESDLYDDYKATPYDKYTMNALDYAQKLMGQPYAQYPNYVSSAKTAPKSYDFYDYQATSPINQIQSPNYKMTADDAQKWQNWNAAKSPQYASLMSGDYNKLQQALTTPGEIAAKQAYSQGLLDLNATMSGNGLYGSSIMGNQMNQGLNREYMNALSTNAANAVAQRYGLQNEQQQALNALRSGDYQTIQGLLANQNLAKNTYNQEARAQDLTRESDINKFLSQNFATDVGQQKNIWTANALETANKQAYNASNLAFRQEQDNAIRNWQNQQAYEKYQYDLARGAYQNQLQEAQMNQALALAGQGAPLSQMANNYSLAQQQLAAAKDQASANSTAGWLSGGLGLLGGLLGTGTGNGNTIGGDLYNSYFGNSTT